jgi:Type I phosphodiesterase / nucleotide pyrophosphatase
MTIKRLVLILLSCGAFTAMCQGGETATQGQTPAEHKTENVILVMIDGMRWQEVFHGADAELIKAPGPDAPEDVKERAAEAQRRYWSADERERRRLLMPFLWEAVAGGGQIFGNRDLGSDSRVTNGLNFSYPGYSETLTGFADPRIHSNDNIPNPNATVFEWLNTKPGFKGRIAAFGAWDTFDGIFAKERCGFLVNAGYDPLTTIPSTPQLQLLNTLKEEMARTWTDEPFDSILFYTVLEYLKAKKPRVLFIGFGETDNWAHAGSYPEYLDAAHLADGYLRKLWSLVQSMPEYQGKTTLIVLPDHGRGAGAKWTSHGQDIPESQQTWMAFLGPDTPHLGERRQASAVTESEIATTLAALLGEDYRAGVPAAGAPIKDVLQR